MDVLVKDLHHGPGLLVNHVLASMTKAEAKDLMRVILDFGIPATDIADVLNEHGFQITAQAINRYRRIIKEEQSSGVITQSPKTRNITP